MGKKVWNFSVIEKAFLTGCDNKTEWMLEWWFREYSKHNDTPVIFADFGVSNDMKKYIKKTFKHIITLDPHMVKGWFLKPQSMIEATKIAKKVCWIDTDCHVLSDISDIFKYAVPNKLTMGEDKPWSKLRGEKWHNSGVVLFEGYPYILRQWRKSVEKNPQVGDQEVLHSMVRRDSLSRQIYIEDLPNEYNWLRLQLDQGHDSKRKKIMHWTGNKGKDKIRRLIKKNG